MNAGNPENEILDRALGNGEKTYARPMRKFFSRLCFEAEEGLDARGLEKNGLIRYKN